MQKDITYLFQRYRECVRHLWNTYFLENADWEVRDSFDIICQGLFSNLVLSHINKVEALLPRGCESKSLAMQFISIVPSATHGVPIMINREPESDFGYWDYPLDLVTPECIELKFVKFYDWDELSHKDLRMYLVTVKSCSIDPNITDRYALIDSEHAKVFFEDEVQI